MVLVPSESRLTLKKARQHRRATPIIDYALPSAHEIKVGAGDDRGFHLARQGTDHIRHICFFDRLIVQAVPDAARFGEQVAKNLLAGRLVPLKAARSFSMMWLGSVLC